MKRTVTIFPEFSNLEVVSIRETQALYETVFDLTCKKILEKEKISKKDLHSEMYEELKLVCPTLPTALIQASRDLACEAIKSYNSNNKKKKYSKIPKMSKSRTMRYDKRTVSLRGLLLTFSTCNKRIRKLIDIPNFFSKRYSKDKWSFQAANIGINKQGKVFINLIFESLEKPIEKAKGEVVGIDRGIYNIVATSEGELIESKNIRRVKRKHSYNRKRGQSKGTRSSHKRLRKMSGREKRFTNNENHVISKKLANKENVQMYVLEDLTKINTLKEKRSKKAKKTQRAWISNWSYFDLEQKLIYKCIANGIGISYVDPRYTSQTCSSCKNVDKGSRNKGRYACPVCGHTEQADINAAKNIRDKFFLTRTT